MRCSNLYELYQTEILLDVVLLYSRMLLIDISLCIMNEEYCLSMNKQVKYNNASQIILLKMLLIEIFKKGYTVQ